MLKSLFAQQKKTTDIIPKLEAEKLSLAVTADEAAV